MVCTPRMTITKKNSWCDMVDADFADPDNGNGLPISRSEPLCQSPSLKVKNTFIEEVAFSDDSGAVDEFLVVDGKMSRFVSEPAPLTSKLLGQLAGPTKGRWSEEKEDSDTDGVSTGPSAVERQESSESQQQETSHDSSEAESSGAKACTQGPGQMMLVPQDIDELTWNDVSGLDAHTWGHGGFELSNDSNSPTMRPQGMMMVPVMMYSHGGMWPMPHGPQTAAPAPLMAMQSQEWAHVYTVMMRNLPNKVTQQQLLQHLDDEGFLNAYDFMYLPIDPETNANRGYAFINFTTLGMALIFRMHFEGQRFSNFHSNKVLSIVPAKLQGFEANYSHYSNAHFNYPDPAAWPLFLREPSYTGKPVQSGKQNSQSLIDQAAKELRRKQQQQKQQAQHALTAARANSRPSTTLVPAVPAASAAPAETAEASEVSASAEVAEGTSSAEESKESSTRVAKFCYSCGGSLEGYFKFCRYCGSSVTL